MTQDRLSSRRILLVDDSADDRALVRQLLAKERPGHAVEEASTGEEALARMRAESFDCLMLDYYLPDATGREVLDLLASDGITLPVVLLTGSDSDRIASEVLSRGAQEYLVKDTVTARGLVRALENAIEKFGAQRELEAHRTALEARNRELERMRAELQGRLAELNQAQRARDRFLAVMSHEMRTPLNAILGYAELMELGISGPLTEDQQSYLDRVRTGGRHLLELINDVLDIAQVDARKLELEVGAVEVEPVLEEVVELLESQATGRGIELRREPCVNPLPSVSADLVRLRQILINLVGNAIKFTECGSVTVRCSRLGDGAVQIHVADTGIGIEPAVLPFVFDEFYQARGGLTRRRGGSGLGLAISLRLARLMGGGIEATSTPGVGSTFTLTLQTSTREGSGVGDAGGRASTSSAALDRVREAGPVEVLVVDDDGDSRRVAATILAEGGIAVREAADGESALAEMRERAPDAVVLDLMMPVVDGFGVLAAMRSDPRLEAVPVIVLTARTPTEQERHFLTRNAERVLQKGQHRLAEIAELVRRSADRP